MSDNPEKPPSTPGERSGRKKEEIESECRELRKQVAALRNELRNLNKPLVTLDEPDFETIINACWKSLEEVDGANGWLSSTNISMESFHTEVMTAIFGNNYRKWLNALRTTE